MNMIEEIISKQLLAAKYHQRTIMLLVNPYLMDLFKAAFSNINSEVEEVPEYIKQFKNGGEVRLGLLALVGESCEHFNTLVMVNSHDADPIAVKEAQMIPADGLNNKRASIENIQIFTDGKGKFV